MSSVISEMSGSRPSYDGSEAARMFEEALKSAEYTLAVDHDYEDQNIDLPSSETASISSSLYDHVEENGRTYHKYKEGKYVFPNDELEQNRLDFQHYLCKLTLHGRLHLAPLKSSHLKNVLDFGTGTGIWAIEFAQQFPKAQVIGSDLSPIQPDFVPENLTFEIDDIDDEWIYPNPFSYIHARLMVMCFTDTDAVFQNAYNSLEPGGWFEMQDTCAPLKSIDGTINGTAMKKVYDLAGKAAVMRGLDLEGPRKYKERMEKIGFVDVKEIVFHWPFGTWPKSAHHKRIGAGVAKDLGGGIKGMIMGLFTRVLGWTKEATEEFADKVIHDFNDKNIHAYQDFIVVYGRKPRLGEVVLKNKKATVEEERMDSERLTEAGEPKVTEKPVIVEKPAREKLVVVKTNKCNAEAKGEVADIGKVVLEKEK